jgi:hypothetical protein
MSFLASPKAQIRTDTVTGKTVIDAGHRHQHLD